MKADSLGGRFAAWTITVAVGWLSACEVCAASGVVPTGVQESVRTASPSTASLTASLEEALAEGQRAKAREILDQLLQRPQVDADQLLAVGVRFAQQELYSEASQAFARCTRDHPELFEAHYNLALADLALQRLPEAFASIAEATPQYAEQQFAKRYLRGKIEAALGSLREAEIDLGAAFTQEPQEENYALDLGTLYLRQGSYSSAAGVFEKGARYNPRSPYLWLGFSVASFQEGKYSQCLLASRHLLALQPEFSPARLLTAFVLDIQGKLAEAEKMAAEGLTASTPDPYLYYLDASLLLKLDSTEYERMLREVALAARGIPACSLCSLAQSRVHQAQGNFAAAITDLERAVNIDPEFSDAWYRLTSLYMRLGRNEDATRARARFEKLKAEKEDREADMLRRVFLQTLSGEGSEVRSSH